MADQSETTTTPPAAPAVDPRDARITDLESKLSAEAETHAFQTNRGDALQKQLDAANAQIKDLQAKAKKGAAAPPADGVYIGGTRHDIIGNFRADNTFVEVKRGHCPEGVTLVAIAKNH